MRWTYEDFKTALFELTGINLSYYKERQMKRRIDALLARNMFSSYNDYFDTIRKDKVKLTQFIDYITINVSEFFRNPEQWEILDQYILPVLLAKHNKLKIWCAACSTGEEPYSLAMLLSRHLPLDEINILATDIDSNALKKAEQSVYKRRNLGNIPDDFIQVFFNIIGDDCEIKDSIKKCVRFEEHNLLKDPFPEKCHLILCRNVMIYFTEEAKGFLYSSFYKSLHSKGILFVGSTEQIILPQHYKFKPTRAFFYEKITEQ